MQRQNPAAMGGLLFVVALCALLHIAAGATPVLPPRLVGDCINPSITTIPAAGLFPSQFQVIGTTVSPPDATVQVVDAKNFEVQYASTYKIVTNKQMNETYVLYQCGTTPPSSVPAGAKLFAIPLQSISVSDSSVIGFMEALDVLDRVAFAPEYVDNPYMQALAQANTSNGGPGCDQVSYNVSSPNISAAPLTSVPAAINFQASSYAKSIAFSSTADPGPLNRAEWIKFISTFFNREQQANALFTSISQSYSAISAAAVQAAPSPRKLVAWIEWWPASSYSQCNTGSGKNVTQKPGISINYPTYKQNLTQDAGAQILGQDALTPFLFGTTTFLSEWEDSSVWICGNATASTGSILRSILQNVDVVVDEARYIDSNGNGASDSTITVSTFLTQYGLSPNDTLTLKFLMNNGLLREDGITNPGSWTGWYERAVVRPDQVLADLVQALNPSVLQQSALANQLGAYAAPVQTSAPYFLRNLGLGQKADVLQPALLPTCRLTAVTICPYVYKACNGTVVYSTDTQACPAACPSSPPPSPSPPHNQAFATARPFLFGGVAAVLLALFMACV